MITVPEKKSLISFHSVSVKENRKQLAEKNLQPGAKITTVFSHNENA